MTLHASWAAPPESRMIAETGRRGAFIGRLSPKKAESHAMMPCRFQTCGAYERRRDATSISAASGIWLR